LRYTILGSNPDSFMLLQCWMKAMDCEQQQQHKHEQRARGGATTLNETVHQLPQTQRLGACSSQGGLQLLPVASCCLPPPLPRPNTVTCCMTHSPTLPPAAAWLQPSCQSAHVLGWGLWWQGWQAHLQEHRYSQTTDGGVCTPSQPNDRQRTPQRPYM
jgi:hypothetical protein